MLTTSRPRGREAWSGPAVRTRSGRPRTRAALWGVWVSPSAGKADEAGCTRVAPVCPATSQSTWEHVRPNTALRGPTSASSSHCGLHGPLTGNGPFLSGTKDEMSLSECFLRKQVGEPVPAGGKPNPSGNQSPPWGWCACACARPAGVSVTSSGRASASLPDVITGETPFKPLSRLRSGSPRKLHGLSRGDSCPGGAEISVWKSRGGADSIATDGSPGRALDRTRVGVSEARGLQAGALDAERSLPT